MFWQQAPAAIHITHWAKLSIWLCMAATSSPISARNGYQGTCSNTYYLGTHQIPEYPGRAEYPSMSDVTPMQNLAKLW